MLCNIGREIRTAEWILNFSSVRCVTDVPGRSETKFTNCTNRTKPQIFIFYYDYRVIVFKEQNKHRRNILAICNQRCRGESV